MNANHQKTFDDMEPVLANEGRERTNFTAVKPHSCKGKQLYEKIQEQKELEALNDPFDY